MNRRNKLRSINAGTTTDSLPPIIRALRKEVAINIDGQEWKICFDFNVNCELEELLGLAEFNELIKAMAGLKTMSFRWLRSALYVNLKHAGAPYSIEEVGQFIHFDSMQQIAQALIAAYSMSQPTVEELQEEETNPTLAVAQ